MEIVNYIEPDVYSRLRDSAGWISLHAEQVEAVLKNSICFSAVEGGKTLGITRVLWDGGYSAYLADVIVDEKYRDQGIGKMLVSRAVEEVKNRMKPGWKVKMFLLAAVNRESFYEQFGFKKRPNESEGCGMNIVLEK